MTILPLALETAIEERAGVSHFQLPCHAGGRIEVRFEAVVTDTGSAFERTRRAVLGFLDKHGVVGARVRHSSAPPLLQAHSGKLQRVLQLP